MLLVASVLIHCSYALIPMVKYDLKASIRPNVQYYNQDTKSAWCSLTLQIRLVQKGVEEIIFVPLKPLVKRP